MKRLIIILFILAAVGLAFGSATRSEAISENPGQNAVQKYEVQKP